jgi:hypothetical protein
MQFCRYAQRRIEKAQAIAPMRRREGGSGERFGDTYLGQIGRA